MHGDAEILSKVISKGVLSERRIKNHHVQEFAICEETVFE